MAKEISQELIDNLVDEMVEGGKINIEEIGGGGRKNRETTESTKKVYLNNIIRLNNKQPIKIKKNGQFDFDFLKDTDKILERLGRLKGNSQRTYLISIVTTLRGLKQYETVYNMYYELMMRLAEELKKNGNTKSETQKENWIEQNKVIEIYENLKAEAVPLLNKKKVTDQEWEIILSFVVLSLYVLQAPRRNKDYQLMLYVNDKNLINSETAADFNYYLPKEKVMQFNQYKTKGSYQMQETTVCPELATIIAGYVKLHPLRKQKNFYLLVNYKGEPLLAVNAITRILNKIFGQRIGASMLRNIYLSDKFKGHMDELNKITTAMGTSASTGIGTYIKMDS
jgi:hypothetical protein